MILRSEIIKISAPVAGNLVSVALAIAIATAIIAICSTGGLS